MSDITEDTVRHLAGLARIALTPEEITRLTGELQAITAAVESVNKVATPDVPATSHPIPMENVWREDVIADQLFGDQHGILIVVAFPGQEANADILAQSDFAQIR